MSVSNCPCRSIIASTNGAVTCSGVLCSVGDVVAGLGIPRPPKWDGRAMKSLSMSLMSDLPVIAGSRSCLIASSSGCSNCCGFYSSHNVCPFAGHTMGECSISRLRMSPCHSG